MTGARPDNYFKKAEEEFIKTIQQIADDGESEDAQIIKTLQSINRTLKRIEILILKDIGNRSAFFDVPAFYQQLSTIGLTETHVESE